MIFFADFFASPKAGGEPGNEAMRVSRRGRLLSLLIVFAGGTLYAAALPPFNLSFLAYLTLVPLLLYATASRWAHAAFAGWLWGVGWSAFAYQFLREIDPAVPYCMAFVISFWPAVWAFTLPFLWRNTVIPPEVEQGGHQARRDYLASGGKFGRLLLFALGAAALFTLLEWTRSRLFTWNDLGVTQWRHPALLQITVLTGSYGLNFLIAFINTALFTAIMTRFRGAGLRVLLAAVLLLTLVMLGGLIRINQYKPVEANWFPAALQGNIPQLRNARGIPAQQALDTYLELSRQAAYLQPKPDLIVWPESAIPVPLRSGDPVGANYRRGVGLQVFRSGIPMLLGSADFEDRPKGDKTPPGITNSALLIDRQGRIAARYDKIHRVPYGEYIPFRSYLPEYFIRRIDMNLDLVPGVNYNPMPLKEDVRAGVAICYEGVFGYLTREFARRGANVLVVLSNDAWYPRSSEPEQHLANAVMRAVETGLPMFRCGNNGGSGVVTPLGEFTHILEVPGPEKRLELRRGRGLAVIPVGVEKEPSYTFYVRHGEWFILALALLGAFQTGIAIRQAVRRKRHFLTIIKGENTP